MPENDVDFAQFIVEVSVIFQKPIFSAISGNFWPIFDHFRVFSMSPEPPIFRPKVDYFVRKVLKIVFSVNNDLVLPLWIL